MLRTLSCCPPQPDSENVPSRTKSLQLGPPRTRQEVCRCKGSKKIGFFSRICGWPPVPAERQEYGRERFRPRERCESHRLFAASIANGY